MKGNEKIAFTAEAVAYMRARDNSDKFSKYFVSPEIERKFKLVGHFIPAYLDRISHKRVVLSSDLDRFVKAYGPEQIIELASGYSTRGLVFTQKDPKLVYIETDFSSVVDRKRKILGEIETAEGISLSKNHHLVPIDAINGDLYDSLKGLINRKKRTLIVAETLTSYLSPTEHDFLVGNIEHLLDKVEEGAYLSHEGVKMLPGLFGKLLLFYRDKVAKTKSYRHFENAQEIKDYFSGRGFVRVKTSESQVTSNIIYLAERRKNK
jgi:O-methyltransferase involved in polyketide biosynthesis